MEGNTTNTPFPKTVMLYVVWLIFVASQVFLALSIHDLIISLAILFSTNAWAPRAIDMWSMVILGIIVLGTIFYTETYLSRGMRKGVFWQHVLRVALIEGVIALAIFLINQTIL